MNNKKQALIITDGNNSIELIANSIEKSLAGFKVKNCNAKDFCGTDILGASSFFIGCEDINPASFSYLAEMLEHVNLAPRKCGIFSTNKKTLKYLGEILKDCEASVGEPLLLENGNLKISEISNWLNKING